jgi:hypothetical protein
MGPPWSLCKRLLITGTLLLTSLVLGWLSIWLPLDDAAHGKTPTYSFKGVMITGAFAYFALIALFFDLRDGTLRYIGPDGKPRLKPKMYFILAGAVVAGGLAVWAFNTALGNYGYTIF